MKTFLLNSGIVLQLLLKGENLYREKVETAELYTITVIIIIIIVLFPITYSKIYTVGIENYQFYR